MATHEQGIATLHTMERVQPQTVRQSALLRFSTTLQRYFELAEREPRLTEVMYDGEGRVVFDIGGELIDDEEEHGLTDDTVLSLGAQAAVSLGTDAEFSITKPCISLIVPPDWRVTVERPPVVEFPVFSMRKLRRAPIPMERYVEDGIMTGAEADQLRDMVRACKTIIVSGGTASGKTTLLRALLSLVPLKERIVSIEDPRELMLTGDDGVTRRPRWVAQEAVPDVMDMDACLRAALRLRPNRIIVGEVRGAEALALVRAMNTGHGGTMFTLHANNPRDALDRLHGMVIEAQPGFRFQTVERSIDAVVQIDGHGGRRKITEIWRPGA